MCICSVFLYLVVLCVFEACTCVFATCVYLQLVSLNAMHVSFMKMFYLFACILLKVPFIVLGKRC